jgi:putative membrane protein
MFPKTKAMAANQGLYNGFLAASLVWSLLINDAAWSQNVALFFRACVFVAGLYGAATVSKRIMYVQSVPSGLAMIALLLS